MREPEGYRDQIERISLIHPDKIALTVEETAKILGVNRRVVTHLIETKKLFAQNVSTGKENSRYLVPIAALARFTTR